MSIKTKTALAFAAFALVCVGTTAGILLHHERVSLETAIVERQELLTVNRAITLRDQLDLALVELMRVARTMEDVFQREDPASEHRVLAQAYRVLVFLTGSVQLYDADGHCKWAEPDPAHCPPRSATDAAFRKTLKRESPTLTFAADADGTGAVHLMAPLLGRGGEIGGVLGGTIELERDSALVKPLTDELPTPATIALVTEDDGLLYTYPTDAVDGMPIVQRILRTDTRPPRGSVRFPHGGADHVVGWAPVGRGDLTLFFVWPWSVLQDAGESLLRQLMWLLIGLGAAALAIGYVMASTLTRPILRLADGLRGAEHHPDLEATTRSDEVGALHNSFRALLRKLAQREEELRRDRDRISELADNLEQRVEERTKQLQNAQEALVRAERLAAVGQAGAVLSHELRNSLNSISVGIDALAGPGLKEAKVRHEVHRDVRGEIERLRSLSDDLLEFAREPNLRLRSTEVWSLLRRTLTLVDDAAQEQEVFVELELDRRLPEIVLDPERMQTALLNLTKNAIEAAAAAPRPRTVRIRATATNGTLRLAFEDSGRGVAPEVAEHLFQPFVTTKHAGTGLGLALAVRFVQAHGGQLTVAPGTLGGASFDIRLPLRSEAKE